jgi:predicted ester cyclase
MTDAEQLERNKAVALRFKKNQGTPAMAQVEKEVLSPNYDRVRGGSFHLAANAHGQDFPHPGMYLRTAFADRVDIIEEVIAEGDRVGLLFKLTATHTGNYFGIAPTGRRIEVYELAMLRIVDGQMVEGWFMMDEVALLKQLGAKLPTRRDGQFMAPALPTAGEDAKAFAQRLASQTATTPQDRNKLVAARSRTSRSGEGRAPGHRNTRQGFEHLREYCKHRGGTLDLDAAIPDRHDKIEALIAEGDSVWMRFSTQGTHTSELCGIAATGKRIGVSVVTRMRFTEGKWTESWTFADELGFMLQLGQPNLLLE